MVALFFHNARLTGLIYSSVGKATSAIKYKELHSGNGMLLPNSLVGKFVGESVALIAFGLLGSGIFQYTVAYQYPDEGFGIFFNLYIPYFDQPCFGIA